MLAPLVLLLWLLLLLLLLALVGSPWVVAVEVDEVVDEAISG